MSREVGRNHPHLRREQLREPVPYIERLQIAVQQHHRPFALQRIAHPDRATAGMMEFLFLNHIRPSTDKAVSLRNGPTTHPSESCRLPYRLLSVIEVIEDRLLLDRDSDISSLVVPIVRNNAPDHHFFAGASFVLLRKSSESDRFPPGLRTSLIDFIVV